MKIRFLIATALFAAVTGISGMASAAPGFATSTLNLRAGPGPQYPIIAQIPVRAGVDINGCVQGWQWCDVDSNGLRGWVSGRHLSADYNRRPVNIIQFGPTIGLPIVIFNQDDYWGHYYHDRPFYRDYVASHPHPVPQPGRGRYHEDRNNGHYYDHHDDDHRGH